MLSSHARLELDSSLYRDASHHLSIRTAGVAYMRENPEKFSDSSTKNSWLHYLNSMSRQGTWADGLIIQEDFETKQKSNEKRKQYIKNKRSTQDADSKKKTNVIDRQYMKRKRADAQPCFLESLIIMLHDFVSQGPGKIILTIYVRK